jgi:spermidine synthase
MLNAIVFVCGAALMALEIVAARVLAPSLGNSIFVWGAVISSVMVALSLGYWLGGQIADRLGATRTFAPIIALSGVLTVLVPLVAKAVLPWSADLGPRAGSLAASALIFFAPSLMMAMVTPLGIRLAATRGLAHIGRSAGALSAVSTAGSIVGTVATSFWLIPLLSLEPLIVSIGFTLLAASLAALYLPLLYRHEVPGEDAPDAERVAHARMGARALAAAGGLVVAGLALGVYVLATVAAPPAFNELGERVLFRKDTQYHRITVTESDSIRRMRFDKSNQSAIYLKDPFTSEIRYPDYMHLALAAKPDAKRVLVLGLGGGAVTKRYWRDYPQVAIDSVEIDPVVVDVSKRYFGLPEDARSRVFAQDARRFVQTSKDTYDIVVIDCYYDDALPFHLTTVEFLTEVKARLAPDGVVVYNVISTLEGERSQLFRSMYRTAGTVWPRLWVFRVNAGQGTDPTTRSNNIVLATSSTLPTDELLRRIGNRVDGRVSIAGFPEMRDDLYTALVELGDVPLMTDAHAPTDSLIQVQ